MGATRKLQGEIDRVLKKVQEGVDVFDGIWNKVYDTENANQKEKFEADLKKEIKKLQRYRDQIKTWIQSSDIKDKKALVDARKLIEKEMERFKICEKETKTKAFSKEGLGQQPKTDPREKAKGEARDWLNNKVSVLDSQIDSFEAEIENLVGRKGKSRPPRLVHLEDSIARHKKHRGKLELILRLLDNDELSPEQVNDVKDFVDDYVERNQTDFDQFDDVEGMYSSLPLDKIEDPSVVDAISVVLPPGPCKDKSGTGGVSPNGAKTTMSSPAQQLLGAGASGVQIVPLPPAVQLPDEVSVPEDSGTQTPPSLTSQAATSPQNLSFPPGLVIVSAGLASNPTTPTSILNRVPNAAFQTGLSSGRGSKPAGTQSPVTGTSKQKEEDTTFSADRRIGSGAVDVGQNRPVRAAGPALVSMPPLSLSSTAPNANATVGLNSTTGPGPLGSDLGKKTGEERFVGGLSQQLAAAGQTRAFVQPGQKLADANATGDGVSVSDGALGANRLNYANSSWRQNPFQNQPEAVQGQFPSRTKIAPDQKQEYVQRFHHVNQQGLAAGSVQQQLSQFTSVGQNKLSTQQHVLQLQLLQHQQGNSLAAQAAALQQQQQQQGGLPISVQPSPSSVASVPQGPQKQLAQHAQQLSTVQANALQQLQQLSLGNSTSSKENDLSRLSEQQSQGGQQPETGDDVNSDVATINASFGRSVSLSEEDLKNSDTFNVSISGPGTLAEFSQLSRDVDFTPGQPVQSAQSSTTGPGVIGRRSQDLGAIGDNLGNSVGNEQIYTLQMLETAYRNIPQPRDSERPKNYVARNRANTPASYPQAPAPILENPALWERLDCDVLFFAFYYQQETYQQYLAARELKKQSWRYHKKYNTWFQRHEEPKVTNDEFEQGTYVYFDFNITQGDNNQGWCQRIKTEFTFEYSYLEDELL